MRFVPIFVLVAAVVVAVAVAVAAAGGSSHAAGETVPLASARIVRTDVVARQQLPGTLGFLGSFTVVNGGSSSGLLTGLPAGGAVVTRGGSLFELNRDPVRLLYGSRPAYRDFALGMSDGADVRDLQRNLSALGFEPGTQNGRFDLATLAAVEQWQRSVGAPATGRLPLGSIVFAPGAVRIGAAVTSVGATVASGGTVESATATTPGVIVPLDVSTGAQVRKGDRVVVTMPDNSSVPGRVTDIGRVAVTPSAQSNGGPSPPPTVDVSIVLLRPAPGALDQSPVQVAITTAESRGVLAVPVDALLAQPGGGYAVRTANGLVPVTTGLFDDLAGMVEISGRGIAPGLRVEVPVQ